MADPLIWARAVHFASTLLLSGTVFFLSFVATPACRKTPDGARFAVVLGSRLAPLSRIAAVLVLISGAAWLLLQTAKIADLPVSQVFSAGAALTVLTRTDFGHDWSARLLLLALLVGATLRFDWSEAAGPCRRLIGPALAAALVGSLAWAGHGAAGSGVAGAARLASDVLHLVAAAGWVGALVPLAISLGAAWAGDEPGIAVAREMTLRFSTVGTISVCTLLATGVLDSWMLVGSMSALTGTEYGRLLLLKVVLVAAMIATAAVNRMILTPRLRLRADTARSALRQLTNNSLVEAGLGTGVLIIVSVLGILPPGIEDLQ